MKYKGFDYELKENDGKWTFVLTHTKYSEDANTKEDAIRKVQNYIDNNLVSSLEKFKEKVLAYRKKFKKESTDDEISDETPQDEIDKITMDVPLLTRVLEYFNENSMDDVKLHKILENLIRESKKGMLGISDYETIIKVDDEESKPEEGKYEYSSMWEDKQQIKYKGFDIDILQKRNGKYISQVYKDKYYKELSSLTEYENEEDVIRDTKYKIDTFLNKEKRKEKKTLSEEEKYETIPQDKLDKIIKYIEENKARSNLILKAAIKHYFNEDIDEADILKYKKGVESKTENTLEEESDKYAKHYFNKSWKDLNDVERRVVKNHFMKGTLDSKINKKEANDYSEDDIRDLVVKSYEDFDEETVHDIFDSSSTLKIFDWKEIDDLANFLLRKKDKGIQYVWVNDGSDQYFVIEVNEFNKIMKDLKIDSAKESEKSDTIVVDGKKVNAVISGSGNKASSLDDERHFIKVDGKWEVDFAEKKESVIVIFNRSVDKEKVRDFKKDADKALGYNFIENDNEPYLFTFNDMDENIVKGLLKRNNLQRGDFQIKTKVNSYEKLKQLKEKLKK